MKTDTPITLARALIKRHGQQASAVAYQHAQIHQARGDSWQSGRWADTARLVNQIRYERREAMAGEPAALDQSRPDWWL
jgi:hypothetical protein